MLPALTLFTTCKPVYELRSGRGPHRTPRSRLARFECVRLLSDRAPPRALTMLPACCSRVSGTCLVCDAFGAWCRWHRAVWRSSEAAVRVGRIEMRMTIVAALALTGSCLATVLASSPAVAFLDDTAWRGPPYFPVPSAYGYRYARWRCGHYWAEPWIVRPCGGRGHYRHHHRKRHDK